MKPLTIGKIAKLSGVGVETVRFYERRGLIEKPPRKASGYRIYPKETVDRIRFIRRAKELGFTLKEIKELLELKIIPEITCEEVRRKAENKIKDIEEKITTLKKIKKSLEKLIATCKNTAPIEKCPILEALEDKEK